MWFYIIFSLARLSQEKLMMPNQDLFQNALKSFTDYAEPRRVQSRIVPTKS